MANSESKPTTKAVAPVVENSLVADVFCAELVRTERIGPCCRLTFATPQCSGGNGTVIRAIVARLIVPAEELQVIARDLLSGRPVDPCVHLDDVSLH